MEYALTAKLAPPADAPALDELQAVGVATLLDEQLELLAGMDGPDGELVEPIDHRVSVDPSGAEVTWLLEAPALALAEQAAGSVLAEVLENTTPLTEWTVQRCEVTASDADLAAAMRAEAGEDGDAEAEGQEPATPGPEEYRAGLLAAATQLHAFGPEDFGHDPQDEETVTAEQAGLVAGALLRGLEVLIDELFADVQILQETGTPVAEQELLWVLDELPDAHAEQYTELFAKQFLVTAAVLGHRLCQPGWTGPLCAAEVLALGLARSRAAAQLELAEVAEELPVEEMFGCLEEAAELREFAVGERPQGWFRPNPDQPGAVHPYLADEDEDEQDSATAR